MKFANIAAAGLAAVMYATSFQPAQAAFVAKPVPLVAGQSDATVVDVRHRKWHRRRNRGAAIAGGLIAGAIIGGAIANSRPRYYESPRYYYGDPYYAPRRVYRPRRYYAPRRVYRARRGSAHVNWCYDRYRSYRASDNTFQPYHGSRRQCWSPYN